MKERINNFIKNPKKALFTLAAPIVVGMLVQALYNIVDTAFVGRLGADAIAALTFSFPLFFIMIAVNSGLSTGMSSRIARFLGADKIKDAENAAMHGLVISLSSAVLIFFFGMSFLRPIFSVFGASNTVLELGISYMSIIFFGFLFMFPSFIMNGIFSAQGDTKTPMKVQISSLVLNMILDPIFIYVLGFGVRGAAIATTISFAFSLSLFVLLAAKKSQLRIHPSSFNFSPKIIKDIVRVGAPASFMTLLIFFYVVFINRFMAYFGTDYVAAFGIAGRLESLAVMPIVAFSIATLTLCGMFFGAKRFDLLKSTAWYSIKITVLFTSAVGALFFIFPNLFLRIFTSDISLLSLSSAYLRIVVFTFPLMTISFMCSRIMQAIGYGLPGLIINLVRIFVVAVPLAYVFVYILGYGYLSIAWAMLLGGIASNLVALTWLRILFNKFKN